jgi:hypothetical protein
MHQLDLLYARLLHVGFIVLRQALDSASQDWINLEYELLHNVPSLIGERNLERHKYFWLGERTLYLERVSAAGGEQARSRMLTYYKPIWDEMEPLMAQLTAQVGARQ